MSNLDIQSSQEHKTVAVITTTIGRETLEKSIISIQNQTYPCKHYVFVDGKQYWHKVKHLEEKYPDVIFTFLPMNTGGENNIGNGAIHAILPYLLKEDIFCFLDDDNWHDPEHVEHLANFISQHNLDYAYSLRRLYTEDYEYLCDDNIESLGFWFYEFDEILPQSDGEALTFSNKGNANLIDTNCYGLTRNIAFQLSEAWYSGTGNDKTVFRTLLKLNARGGVTGKRTANYKLNLQIRHTGDEYIDFQEHMHSILSFFKSENEKLVRDYELPWLIPTVLINGKLTPVE